MRTYDFIIVGLGTAGAATCMTLTRRGYRRVKTSSYFMQDSGNKQLPNDKYYSCRNLKYRISSKGGISC